MLSVWKGSLAKKTYRFKEPTNRSLPIVVDALGVSFNLSLQSQSDQSLFNGTWPKRRREPMIKWVLRLKKWHSKCYRRRGLMINWVLRLLMGLFSTKCGKKDMKNWFSIEFWDPRNETPHAIDVENWWSIEFWDDETTLQMQYAVVAIAQHATRMWLLGGLGLWMRHDSFLYVRYDSFLYVKFFIFEAWLILICRVVPFWGNGTHAHAHTHAHVDISAERRLRRVGSSGERYEHTHTHERKHTFSAANTESREFGGKAHTRTRTRTRTHTCTHTHIRT